MSLGRSVAFPGHPLGSGLTPVAAKVRNIVLKDFDLVWILKTPYVSKHACIINDNVGERRICSGVLNSSSKNSILKFLPKKKIQH